MRILRLDIRNFRGIEHMAIQPRGHVLLVGEPGAGRSDVITAITRVLHPNSTRWALEVWDIHGLDRDKRVEIEVVLGGLGSDLEQLFIRQLEVWDRTTQDLVATQGNVQELDVDTREFVLRLSYVARWLEAEDAGEHFVHFPKTSDEAADRWVRPSRAERLALPFVAASPNRPLQVRVEGDFRRLLELLDAGSGNLSGALDELAKGVEHLTGDLSAHSSLIEGIERVLEPLRVTLDLDSPANEVIRFAPEGGSLAGLLRGLEPSVDIADGAGFLPLRRHGSSLTGQLSGAEALALAAVHEVRVRLRRGDRVPPFRKTRPAAYR